MTYVLIAVGGATGSLVRYSLGKFISEKSNTAFPIGTFIINISGAILLGIVSTIGVSNNMMLLLGDGFLGAYTTFGGLCKETVNLMNQGYYYSAMSYIGFSTILGLAFAYFGVILAREVVSKFVLHQDDSDNVELEEAKEVD